MKSLAFVLDNLSVVLELAVIVLGVLIAIKKKKSYGWLVAIGFSTYVLYNLVALHSTIQISGIYFALALFAGTAMVLGAFWMIYKEK